MLSAFGGEFMYIEEIIFDVIDENYQWFYQNTLMCVVIVYFMLPVLTMQCNRMNFLKPVTRWMASQFEYIPLHSQDPFTTNASVALWSHVTHDVLLGR